MIYRVRDEQFGGDLPVWVPAHQQAQHLEFTFSTVDRKTRKRRLWASAEGSGRVHPEVSGEAVTQLDQRVQFGMANEDHAVGDEGCPPVAPLRSDRQ